jgi:hypothetical protein
MVKNDSTNINQIKNHLSPQIIEHKNVAGLNRLRDPNPPPLDNVIYTVIQVMIPALLLLIM